MALTIDSQESAGDGHRANGTTPLTWSFTNTARNLLLVGVIATSARACRTYVALASSAGRSRPGEPFQQLRRLLLLLEHPSPRAGRARSGGHIARLQDHEAHCEGPGKPGDRKRVSGEREHHHSRKRYRDPCPPQDAELIDAPRAGHVARGDSPAASRPQLAAQILKLERAERRVEQLASERDQLVFEICAAGARIADVADVLGTSRTTVYAMLERAQEREP
jgi:hypothetical protein